MDQAARGCNADINAEILYIVQRYLASTACHDSATALQREMERHNLLPKRLDWMGNSHRQSFAQFEHDNAAHVPATLLPQVFAHLLQHLTTALPPALPALQTRLIQAGHQYILRTKKSIMPKHRLCDSLRPEKWHCKLSKSYTEAVCEPHAAWHLLNRQLTGRLRKPSMLSAAVIAHFKVQHRILGHLSCVFCVMFDRTGQYLFTGADDNLVKVWQVQGARLLFTFRGCAGEITDLAVSHENTLLAAGSVDRTIRVWCLRTGSLISVLMGHSAMVTSIVFLPYINGDTRFLLSISNDCCVCFWMWNAETFHFETEPTKYCERERVGAQMIGASHSPSGAFVVTGCTDHYIRVYKLSPEDGIDRIFEAEAHTDRVDSLRWAHAGLRFASGSKDGTVRIWRYEKQKWRSILLNVADTKPNNAVSTTQATSTSAASSKANRLRVTMIAWNNDDSMLITAASDSILRVWDATSGAMLRFLEGHKDEAFCLEPHPLHSHIMLSAGHDGYCILWDIVKGVQLCKHHNSIQGQGFGALFDAKFSPTDPSLAATVDSHGHLILLKAGTSDKLRKDTPREQFFHTDYRPVVRDAAGFVLDEQTQLAIHLMPPPFLVQSNGNPHEPNLQRRVPGREKCPDAFLQPITVSRMAEVDNEDIHLVEVMEPDSPSVVDNTLEAPSANSGSADVLPLCVWTNRVLVSALDTHELDSSVATRLQLQVDELALYEKESNNRVESNASFSRDVQDEDQQTLSISESVRRRRAISAKTNKSAHVYGTRRNRQTTAGVTLRGQRVEEPTSNVIASSPETDNDQPATIQYSPWDEPEMEYDEEETSESSSSSATSDSEYAEEMKKTRRTKNNQSPARKSKRRARVVEPTHSADESAHETDPDDEQNENEPSTSTGRRRKRGSPPAAQPARRRSPPESPKKQQISVLKNKKKAVTDFDPHNMPNHLVEFPQWLMGVEPRKFPYVPQVGDEIVYFSAGHRAYFEAVEKNKFYEIAPKMRPKNDLDGEEFGLVEEVSYELEPYRLCCLKIAQIHATTKNLTSRVYKIWYHDVDNVVDFVVLKAHYEKGMSQKWKPGNRFQSLIDDCWWFGSVEKRESYDVEFPHCPFQSLWVTWDNGETERMSPWDLEQFHDDMYVKRKGAELKATQQDYVDVAQWNNNELDWPIETRETLIERLESSLQTIEGQPYVQCFMQPVDLRDYPLYPASVPYPIDMYTIKLRLNANFYRRLAAVEFDIRMIAENAERFNEQNSDIVKYSHIFCETLLRFLRDPGVDLYDTFVHLDENEFTASFSHLLQSNFEDSPLKKAPKRRSHKAQEHANKTTNVMSECKQLMVSLLETADAAPFLGENTAPELSDVFDSFLTLTQVRDQLMNNKYASPEDLANDVYSMLQNVRNIATNKRSTIFKHAIRLSSLLMDRITPLVERWKTLTGANDAAYRQSKAYNTRTKRKTNARETTCRVSRRSRVVAQLSSDGEEEVHEPGPSNAVTISVVPENDLSDHPEEESGDTSGPGPVSKGSRPASQHVNNALPHEEREDDDSASNSEGQENEDEEEDSEESSESTSEYSDAPRARRQAPPKPPPKPRPSIRPQLRLKNERELEEQSDHSPPPRPSPKKRTTKRGRSPPTTNGRTPRLRGARKVDYNEHSEESESETVCTSSRGRIRKVRKFS